MHFCSWCDKLHCPLGKIKTDNSIVFFPFSFHGIFLSGWLVCACWKGVLVSFSASQACGICSRGFILYTTVHWLWELISSVLHSPTHISFLFFFPLSDHPWFFFKKVNRKLPAKQMVPKYSNRLLCCHILGHVCIYCLHLKLWMLF